MGAYGYWFRFAKRMGIIFGLYAVLLTLLDVFPTWLSVILFILLGAALIVVVAVAASEDQADERAKEQQKHRQIASHQAAVRAKDSVSISVHYENWKDEKFPATFARAHRDEILEKRGDYLGMYQKLSDDKEVLDYLTQFRPDVVAVFKARAETFYLAQRIEAGDGIGTSTPEQHRQRVINRAEVEFQDNLTRERAALSHEIQMMVALRRDFDEQIKKHPELKAQLEAAFIAYLKKRGLSDEPPPSQEPPEPIVY